MSILAEDSLIIAKTKELCELITKDSHFRELQASVERFIADDGAKAQYQNVNDRGEELNNKQRAGIELGSNEKREFETARDALFENKTAREFIEAQRGLETFQAEVAKYISSTIELGRVPTADELAASGGGCCGGGSCGC